MNEYNAACCKYADRVDVTVVAGSNILLLHSYDSPRYSHGYSSSYGVKFRIIILIIFHFKIALFT